MIDKTLWQPANFYWLVGLFEGEGSITQSGNSRPNLRVKCEMSDEDIILKFSIIVGFGKTTTYQSNKQRVDGSLRKKTWAWYSNSLEDVYRFEVDIFPYLGAKKQGDILRTHKARKDYELATSGNHIKRIFTTSSGELLPDSAGILF